MEIVNEILLWGVKIVVAGWVAIGLILGGVWCLCSRDRFGSITVRRINNVGK